MSTLAIKNIGILVSGDIKDPILKYNAILVENGIIKKLEMKKF